MARRERNDYMENYSRSVEREMHRKAEEEERRHKEEVERKKKAILDTLK